MPWTLVGSTTSDIANGSGTTTVALPGSPAAGDVVIVALASHGNVQYGEGGEGGVATPGYVRLLQGVSSPVFFDGSQAAYKLLTTTVDANVEIARSGNTQAVAIQVWRGADPHHVLDATPVRSGSSSGLPDPPAVTTATNGALVVAVGFLRGVDDSANTTAPSGYSNLVVNGYGAASASATIMLASKEVATAGAEDPAAFGGAASATWRGLTFALRPDDATDPTPAWTRVCEMVCQVDVGSATRSFSFPEAPATDDLVVVLMGSDEEMGTGAAADGGINTAGYIDLDASTTANTPGYKLAYKVMGGTPDTAIIFAESNEREQVALVRVWRGVDTGTPIDAAVQTATGTSAAPDPPAVTTAQPDALVIACAVVDDIGFEAGGIAYPTGYTHPLLGYCGSSALFDGATVLMAVKQVDAPGAENPSAFAASGSDQWRAMTFALRSSSVAVLIDTAQEVNEAVGPTIIETAQEVGAAQQLDLTVNVTWRRPTRIDYTFPRIVPIASSIPVVVDAQAIDSLGARMLVGAGASETTASGGRPKAQWDGASIQRSADGVSFGEVVKVDAEATFGFLVEALPSGSTAVPDDTNTLRVKVYKDRPLGTITRAQLLTGRYNLAAIGNNDKGWEIISFEAPVGTIGGIEDDVGVFDEYTSSYQTPLARYDITGLLRGLHGTEHLVGSHAVGDRFVLLDAAMVEVAMAEDAAGQRYHWRAVTTGASPREAASASPITETFAGRAMKLPPPTNLAGTRSPDPGVTQDLTITWTPRGVEGSWLVDPPFSALGIAGWEIDVLNASEAVVRTLTTTVTANGSSVDSDASAASAFYDYDDLSADLGADMGLAVPVTNPGAETGDLTGWTSSAGTMASLTVREDTFPRSGFRMFAPNAADAEHIITQQIELVTIPEFDDPNWLDGNTKATAKVWQANSIAGDTGQIILRAIDADTTTVLATVTSTLQAVSPIETWQQVATAQLTIPAAARYLRVELRAVKVGGSDAGVCFDDVTLRLEGRVGPVRVKVYPLSTSGARGFAGEVWV